MDLRKHFGTNKAAELTGVWVPMPDGGRIKLARLGNRPYQQCMEDQRRRRIAATRAGALDPDEIDVMVNHAVSLHIVKDWEGIFDGEAELAYSPETCEKLLSDMRDFRDFVMLLAGDLRTFQVQEVTDNLGNSESALHGNSDGATASETATG